MRSLVTAFFVLVIPIVGLSFTLEDDLEEAPSTAIPSEDGLPGLLEIPPSLTGTDHSEWVAYQIPSGYSQSGPGHPMVVCWHGYGESCLSVASETLIDEECEERNWIYISITGYSQTNIGDLNAQIHCKVAIWYMIDVIGLNIDTSRIYMVGFSTGAFASASYTCRHMSEEEGHPIAGLIAVAPFYDLIHLFYNDPGLQQYLAIIMGGTPLQNPWPYKQISTLYIDNNTYVENESMGQNLRHGFGAYFTYAGNDPLPYIPFQNEVFIDMMNDIGTEYFVDYHATHYAPHSWNLLDVEAALDYMEMFTLEDQNTDTINILADRDAKFYWADISQTEVEAFSRITGTVDDEMNELAIEEALNVDLLNVDCEETGLNDENPLFVEFLSSSLVKQNLVLEPLLTEPTYLVDSAGKVFPYYSYTNDQLTIKRYPAKDLELKASFAPYNLTFIVDPIIVKIGESYSLTIEGGAPDDPALIFFCLDQSETKVGPYHILVNPFDISLWIYLSLNAGGSISFDIPIPSDPSLSGLVIYHQGLTYEPSIKEISNLSVIGITD